MPRPLMSSVVGYSDGAPLTTAELDSAFGLTALQSDMTAVQSTVASLVSGSAIFAVAGGTSDALTVSIPAITSLVDGTQINVRAVAANTTTTPTITINALGTFAVTKLGSQPLDIGDIQPDLEITLRYDAVGPKFQLLKSVLTAIPSIAALRGKVGVSGQVVFVSAYYAGIVGGDGNFYWNATSTATDDGGHVINPTGNTTGRWMRMFTGRIFNVKNFGARGLAGGGADDFTFCNAALTACRAVGTTSDGFSGIGTRLYFPADTYYLSQPLELSTVAGSVSPGGIDVCGDNRGNTLLRYTGGVANAPVIAADTEGATTTVRDLSFINTFGYGVRVRGNGQLLTNLWGNCVTLIYIESWIDSGGHAVGTEDVQVNNIIGDQCFNSTITIANNSGNPTGGPSTIALTNIESFGGGGATPFQQGFQVLGHCFDITVNGLKTVDTFGRAVVIQGDVPTGYPEVAIDNYTLNGTTAVLGGATGAVHRAISVDSAKVTLGSGIVSFWSAEGLYTDNTTSNTVATVVDDNGAVFHDCCLSSAATNKTLSRIQQTDYFKSGGSFTGNGAAGNELTAILHSSNTLGSLQIGPAVRFANLPGRVIQCVNAGTGSAKFVSIQGAVIESCNLANNPANTPIEIDFADVANISNCIIKNTNATTAAIASSAVAGNFTYNLAKSGTFPAVATHVQSVGNALY